MAHEVFIDAHKSFKCYGRMTDHDNEEARSRVIASASGATLINSDPVY